jgi:hypothetical protein
MVGAMRHARGFQAKPDGNLRSSFLTNLKEVGQKQGGPS